MPISRPSLFLRRTIHQVRRSRLQDTQVDQPRTAIELSPDLVNLVRDRRSRILRAGGVQDTDTHHRQRFLSRQPSDRDRIAVVLIEQVISRESTPPLRGEWQD